MVCSGFPSDSRFHDYLHGRGYIDKTARSRHLEPYLRFFDQGARVLDVGCGRGEFLALLRDKGCDGIGVDVDAGMVAACKENGENVVEADVFDYLPGVSDLDGLFASNFLEHLPPKPALGFLRLASGAIRPDGIIVLAVPNPQSLIVHLHEFWRDLTHARMYDLQLLEFLLEDAGFKVLESGSNEATLWTPEIESVHSGDNPLKLAPASGFGELRHRLAALGEMLGQLEKPGTTQSSTNPDVRGEGEPYDARTVSRGYPELPLARRLFRRARRAIARFMAGDIIEEEVGRTSSEISRISNELSRQISMASSELSWQISRLSQESAQVHVCLDHLQTYLARDLDRSELTASDIHQDLSSARRHTASLATALLFLFPPREIYVVGRKTG